MGMSIKMRWTGRSESRWVKKIVQTTPKNLPPTQFNNKESVNLSNFWKIGTLGQGETLEVQSTKEQQNSAKLSLVQAKGSWVPAAHSYQIFLSNQFSGPLQGNFHTSIIVQVYTPIDEDKDNSEQFNGQLPQDVINVIY